MKVFFQKNVQLNLILSMLLSNMRNDNEKGILFNIVLTTNEIIRYESFILEFYCSRNHLANCNNVEEIYSYLISSSIIYKLCEFHQFLW